MYLKIEMEGGTTDLDWRTWSLEDEIGRYFEDLFSSAKPMKLTHSLDI